MPARDVSLKVQTIRGHSTGRQVGFTPTQLVGQPAPPCPTSATALVALGI
jgi:hypothetical protein